MTEEIKNPFAIKQQVERLTQEVENLNRVVKKLVGLSEFYDIPEVDENAETLEDKLRVEHTPTLEELEQLNIPEEREDKSLFKSIADAHIEGVKDLNKIFNPKGIKFE
jgi:hypothetical protein